MTMDRGERPDARAQNFLKVLTVIDRTILPRKVLIGSGSDSLALMVSRQRAFRPEWRNPAASGLLQGLAASIVEICQRPRPVAIRVEPASARPVEGMGFTAIEIVNGQERRPDEGEAIELRNYRFGENGWPLAAAPGSSMAMLMAAAGFASALSAWQGRHRDKVVSPMLILGVSQSAMSDLSVAVGDDMVVARAGLAQLGQIVSQWQSGLKQKDKPGR
jgi:hypothetical protein